MGVPIQGQGNKNCSVLHGRRRKLRSPHSVAEYKEDTIKSRGFLRCRRFRCPKFWDWWPTN